MTSLAPIPYIDKFAFYKKLSNELNELCESAWFTNMANVSALLMAQLPQVSWVGFYLAVDETLRLGPFQGLPADRRIPSGKGVCGTAAQMKKTLIVGDIDQFPGHIACDTRSRSEIAVPLIKDDRLIGILDVDSMELDRFDEDDKLGLQLLMNELLARTEIPATFA